MNDRKTELSSLSVNSENRLVFHGIKNNWDIVGMGELDPLLYADQTELQRIYYKGPRIEPKTFQDGIRNQ